MCSLNIIFKVKSQSCDFHVTGWINQDFTLFFTSFISYYYSLQIFFYMVCLSLLSWPDDARNVTVVISTGPQTSYFPCGQTNNSTLVIMENTFVHYNLLFIIVDMFYSNSLISRYLSPEDFGRCPDLTFSLSLSQSASCMLTITGCYSAVLVILWRTRHYFNELAKIFVS